MTKNKNNYAFIDSQNINLGVRRLGWRLDWQKFRIYLREKYGVEVAYLFIGFIPDYIDLYTEFQKAGFILCFKPVLFMESGRIKGNIDADLVLQAAIEQYDYERAIIATSDGDFYSLVKYLCRTGKLVAVLSPCSATCSAFLKKAAKGKMAFMDRLKRELMTDASPKNERAPQQDGT